MIVTYLFFCGFLASCVSVGFAKVDKEYGEMRAHISIAVLFFLLFIDRVK